MVELSNLSDEALEALDEAAMTAFRVYGKAPLGNDAEEFEAALRLLALNGLAVEDQIDVLDAQEKIDEETERRRPAVKAAPATYGLELWADGLLDEDGLPSQVEVTASTMTAKLFITPKSNGGWDVKFSNTIRSSGWHGFPTFVAQNHQPIDQAYDVATRAIAEAGLDPKTASFKDIGRVAK